MQKTIKRLALVASAAVAFAGITGVAAKAAVNAVTYGYTSTATTVGGTALTAAPSGTTYTKNTSIASDALSTFTVPSASVIRYSKLKEINSFRCLQQHGPPLPIPNREVKPDCADGTAILIVGE